MSSSLYQLSRRAMVAFGCAGLAGLASGVARAQSSAEREPLDVGGALNGSLRFDPIAGPTEPTQKPQPAPLPPVERVGFAIAGVGRLAGEEVFPAFAACRRAKIAALVSGSPEKAAAICESLGLQTAGLYSYETFERIADDPSVKVVYVITPNALHKDLVIRAAQAGKHVLCEKPMATSWRKRAR